MHRMLLFVLFALVAGVSGIPGDGAQAASSPEVCLKTCIETYGADKKQACALQCGFGAGNTGAGQSRDCGAIYKQCLQQCGGDNSCKNSCRKQRTQCY